MGCVVAPCLLTGVTYGFIKFRLSQSGSKLPDELAKLRSMGVPTIATDLTPNPVVTDEDNAAFLYKEFNQKVKDILKARKMSASASVLASYGTVTSHPNDQLHAIQDMKEIAEPLAILDRLIEKPRYYQPRDYTKGAGVLFPELAEMKTAAKLLGGRAKVQWETGDLDGARRSIALQFQIARHLSEEPTIIGALVCIAVNSIAFVTLDQYLEVIKNNPDALAKTLKMLEERKFELDLRKGFYGEVVMGRYAIQQLKSWNDFSYGDNGEPTGWQKGLDRWTIGDPSVRKMLEWKFVSTWRGLFEKFPKDPTDWQSYDKVFSDLAFRLETDMSLENRLNQVMFPVFSQLGISYVQMRARQRLGILATKLLLMRKTGLPPNLAGFGEIGIDPITGLPMGYYSKGKGFKVWSVGQNQVDDGGLKYISGVTKTNSQESDIVLGYDIGFAKPIRVRVVRPALPRTGSGVPGGPESAGLAPSIP